jgi:hypothetical protein
VQVEFPHTIQLPAVKAAPGGGIDAWRLPIDTK